MVPRDHSGPACKGQLKHQPHVAKFADNAWPPALLRRAASSGASGQCMCGCRQAQDTSGAGCWHPHQLAHEPCLRLRRATRKPQLGWLLSVFALTVALLRVGTAWAGVCDGPLRLDGLREGDHGFFGDGDGEYGALQQCEWLLEAASPDLYISLNFESYATECEYDYVFVYDGDSFQSPQLAALSGNTLPDPIVAHSGKLLVLFYSDSNYVLQGFKATFNVQSCTATCVHGSCEGATCRCDPGWKSHDCNVPVCPNNCGEGRCSEQHQRCLCPPTHTGADCATEIEDDAWYTRLSGDALLAGRGRHAAAMDQETSILYVFGGHDFGNFFSDLLAVNLKTMAVTMLSDSQQQPGPAPRHSATLTLFRDTLVLVGGVTKGGISNEVWTYNVTAQQWSQQHTGPACVAFCPVGWIYRDNLCYRLDDFEVPTTTTTTPTTTSFIPTPAPATGNNTAANATLEATTATVTGAPESTTSPPEETNVNSTDTTTGTRTRTNMPSDVGSTSPSGTTPTTTTTTTTMMSSAALSTDDTGGGGDGDDVLSPEVQCVAEALPPLADHTATLVGSDVYLIGGRSDNDEFHQTMHRLRLGISPFPEPPRTTSMPTTAPIVNTTANATLTTSSATTTTTTTTTTSFSTHSSSFEMRVERVPVAKPVFAEMAGHTSVYHAGTDSIYVFGGFKPYHARYADQQDDLHIFHVAELAWSQPRIPAGGRAPALAYHTATLIGDDTMVVYGGSRHVHHQEEVCYYNQLHVFHITCHAWSLQATPATHGIARGRKGHVAAAVDNTLFVVGGFDGRNRGDVLSFRGSPGWCTAHTKENRCTATTACGACVQPESGGSDMDAAAAFIATHNATLAVAPWLEQQRREPGPAVAAYSQALDLLNASHMTVPKVSTCLAACLQANGACIAVSVVGLDDGSFNCSLASVSSKCAAFAGATLMFQPSTPSIASAVVYEKRALAAAPCALHAPLLKVLWQGNDEHRNCLSVNENGPLCACAPNTRASSSTSAHDLGSLACEPVQACNTTSPPASAARMSTAAMTTADVPSTSPAPSSTSVLSTGTTCVPANTTRCFAMDGEDTFLLHLAPDVSVCTTASVCIALRGVPSITNRTCNLAQENAFPAVYPPTPHGDGNASTSAPPAATAESATSGDAGGGNSAADEELPFCFADAGAAGQFFRNLSTFDETSVLEGNVFPDISATTPLLPTLDAVLALPQAADPIVIPLTGGGDEDDTSPAATAGTFDARHGECYVSAWARQPLWSVTLPSPTPVHRVALQGSVPACFDVPGASGGTVCLDDTQQVRVIIGTDADAPLVGTSCGSVAFSGSNTAPASVFCDGSVATVVTVVAQAGPTVLALCSVEVFASPDAGAVGEGVACGGAGHGVWQPGSCTPHCNAHRKCSECAADDLCVWCHGSGTCVRSTPLTGEVTSGTTDACPVPTDVPVEAEALCHLQRPFRGATRERYFSLRGAWNLHGFRTSYNFRNQFPTDTSAVSDFIVRDTDDNFAERIHGFFVPPRTDTYRFYIRSRQAYYAELFFSSKSTEPQDAVIVARQSPTSDRPQLSFTHSSVRSLTLLSLQAGRRYYIASQVFVYSRGSFGRHEVAVAAKRSGDVSPLSDDDIIPASQLRPYEVDECSSIDNCFGCMAAANCGWCNNRCMPLAQVSPSACASFAYDDAQCAECSEHTDCGSCTASTHCEWILYTCRRFSGDNRAVTATNGKSCPVPCSQRTSCGQCTNSNSCGWCESTHTCFQFAGYLTRFSNGACRSWHTSPSTCPACSSHTTCSSCVAQFECGWLHPHNNSGVGACVPGDFASPFDTTTVPEALLDALNTSSLSSSSSSSSSSSTAAAAQTLLPAGSNVTASDFDFSYASCPDVNECRFGYHDCPGNATCVDETQGQHLKSFRCECNAGYAPQRGKNDDSNGKGGSGGGSEDGDLRCVPQCLGCVQGECIAPGVCQCLPFFSGPNCTECTPVGTLISAAVPRNSSTHSQNPTTTTNDTDNARDHDAHNVNATSPAPTTAPTISTAGAVLVPLGFNVCGANAVCAPLGWNTSLSFNLTALDQQQHAMPANTTTFQCQCRPDFAAEVDASIGCAPQCERAGCVHGTCVEPDVCDCDGGWTGDNCTTCIQGYHDACHEHAECFDDDGQLGCRCKDGYAGDGRTVCSPICNPPCSDFGSCVAPNQCRCEAGFAGLACDRCNASAAHTVFGCDPHAACRVTLDPTTQVWSQTCECNPGYQGPGSYCEPVCSACEFGVCVEPDVCECSDFSSGEACDACGNVTMCSPHALCTKSLDDVAQAWESSNSSTTSTSNTTSPTSGENREQVPLRGKTALYVVNVRRGGSSSSSGTSRLINTTYVEFSKEYCACPPGYEGSGVSCTPVCTRGCVSGACSFHVHGDGAFGNCTCAPGFTGIDCSLCVPDTAPCTANASCVPAPTPTSKGTKRTNDSFVCQCDDGFAGDGHAQCSPVCPQGCVHGTCTAPGVCECAPGFAGANCTACDAAAPDYPCASEATCVMAEREDGVGFAPQCSCLAGYRGNGSVCSPVCSRCVFGHCAAPETCVCNDGFVGRACEGCDPENSPCSSFASCLPLNTSTSNGSSSNSSSGSSNDTSTITHACVCDVGYVGDPYTQCDPVCEEPCLRGNCTAPNTCTCADGFMGDTCEQCIPDDHRCTSNASCILRPTSTTSTAAPNLTMADTNGSSSSNNSSAAGNTTTTPQGVYLCTCDAGFEEAEGICEPVCTQNCVHGTCVAPDVCRCEPGWHNVNNTDCSECDAAFSSANPCGDYAVCTGVQCSCQDGYAPSSHASVAVGLGECSPVCAPSCVNGGCVAPDTCQCDPNWGGPTCEHCPANTMCAERGAECSKLTPAQGAALAAQYPGLRYVFQENATLDLVREYACECAQGWVGDGSQCQPTCDEPCINGECTAHNLCTCDRAPGSRVPAWTGPRCTQCVASQHGCHPNATCTAEGSEVTCQCLLGFQGDGTTCSPVCEQGCLYGTCVAPNTCVCDVAPSGTEDEDDETSAPLPAWAGANCSICLPHRHGCHPNATCTGPGGHEADGNGHESAAAVCACDEGFTGDGVTCAPVCSQPCVNGTCTAPEVCACDLGYTGLHCNISCNCSFSSTCERGGPGVCDACQLHTTGPACSLCSEGFYGNPGNGIPCQPCDCNGHGTCHHLTGECECDVTTEGDRCQRCRSTYHGNPRNGRPCYRYCTKTANRFVLTEREGWISSGPTDDCAYSNSKTCHETQVACVFVIAANDSTSVVRLETEKLGVECGYDSLRVFAGGSFHAPEIAVLMGHIPPPPLYSRGAVALHWFSDFTWAEEGFKVHYVIEDCPFMCSGHGACNRNTGMCTCDSGWTGEACEVEQCPNNCSAALGQGVCDSVSARRCLCAPGFTSRDCGMPVHHGGWNLYLERMPTPSAGASAVFDPAHDEVLLFGGRPPQRHHNQALSDELVAFHITNRTFRAVHTRHIGAVDGGGSDRDQGQDQAAVTVAPSPRYGHSAVLSASRREMFVFGGRLEGGQVSDELFSFHLDDNTWRRVNPSGPSLEARFLHTATLVGDRMFLIGGAGNDDGLVFTVQMVDLNSHCVENVSPRGAHPAGLIGHTAVFVPSLGGILVVGGVGMERQTNGIFNQRDRFAYRSIRLQDDVYILQTFNATWKSVSPLPRGRAFHSSFLLGNFLVVFSGVSFQHGSGGDCPDSDVQVYDTTCDVWLPTDSPLVQLFRNGEDTALPLSRSLAAVAQIYAGDADTGDEEDAWARHPASAWAFGGFGRAMLDDVVEVRLPNCSAVSRNATACAALAGCVWCSATRACRAGTTSTEGEVCQREERACAASPSCNSISSCQRCSSRDDCQWEFSISGSFAGITGSCSRRKGGSQAVRDPLECDECGIRSNCKACADTALPERSTRCAWFEQSSFREHFCFPPSSPISALPDTVSRPSKCPDPCSSHTSCGACEAALGCQWCESLQLCQESNLYAHINAMGQCAHTNVDAGRDMCPKQCSSHRTCSECLETSVCGWCVDPNTGQGVCTEGEATGAHSPTSQCHSLVDQQSVPVGIADIIASSGSGNGEADGATTSTIDTTTTPTTAALGDTMGTAPTLATATAPLPTTGDTTRGNASAQWWFFACPDVDECAASSPCAAQATCTNVVRPRFPSVDDGVDASFACTCNEGYAGDGLTCTPVCTTPGCSQEHGTCTAPDVCECDTGFTGPDCSQECPCNQHSSCESGACDRCKHHTTGEFCQRCEPGFFGNATRGTPNDCRPCADVCNGHATQCFSSLVEAADRPVCMDCDPESHTTGTFCHECVDGYYLDSNFTNDEGNVRCIPCPCGGRGSSCDPLTGTNCQCFPEERVTTHNPQAQCASCQPGYIPSATDPSTGYLRWGDACYRAVNISTSVASANERVSVTLDASAPAHRVAVAPLGHNTYRPFRNTVLSFRFLKGEVTVDVVSASAASSQNCEAGTCQRFTCSELLGSCFQLSSANMILPEWTNASATTGSDNNNLRRRRRRRHAMETDAVRRDEAAADPFAHTHAIPRSDDTGLRVVLDCSVFNFLQDGVYVTLRVPSSAPSPVTLEYALGYSAEEDGLRCAACLDCGVPCVPGYFLDPDATQRFRCRPCECNGHGDRCNVLDGGDCGLASEGCDVVTGENCDCAHNTVSVAVRTDLRPHEYQCNRCRDAVATDGGGMVALSGVPENGKQCYQQLVQQAVQAPSLAPGESQFFLFTPGLFTNVDLRVTVDVWQGTVTMLVSTDNSTVVDLSQATGDAGGSTTAAVPTATATPTNTPTPTAGAPAVTADSLQGAGTATTTSPSSSLSSSSPGSGGLVSLQGMVVPGNSTVRLRTVTKERVNILFSHQRFNFSDTVFYMTVVNTGLQPALLRVFSTQPVVSINLVVFFCVFFCVFFLVIAVGTGVHKLYRLLRAQQSEREEMMALESLARRPAGRTTLLLSSDVSTAATLAGAKDRVQWGTPVPLAVQPLSAQRKHEAISAFVVELPGSQAHGAPALALGIAHTTTHKQGHGKRRRRHKRKRIAAVNPLPIGDTRL